MMLQNINVIEFQTVFSFLRSCDDAFFVRASSKSYQPKSLKLFFMYPRALVVYPEVSYTQFDR